MDKDDPMVQRMVIGQMMRQQWEENPPEPEDWAKALDGCAKLYEYAAEHVRTERYAEAARCVASAVKLGSEVHAQLVLAYAMSGQAVDDFMNTMREPLARYEQNGQE